MRFVDLCFSLPFVFLVIFLIGIVNEYRQRARGPLRHRPRDGLLPALGAFTWLSMARVVRGQVLALRKREFVEAARVLGASRRRILLVHLVPNVLPVVLVYLTLTVPSVMLYEAFLSFLGLGIERQGELGPPGGRGRRGADAALLRLVARALARARDRRDAAGAQRARGRAARRARPASGGGPAVSLLEVEELEVAFPTRAARARGQRALLSVDAGETLAIVGESGSGKSVAQLAVLDLLPPSAEVRSKRIAFDGKALEARKLRGRELAIVFQDPLSALHPLLTIGEQLAEVLETHERLARRAARARALAALAEVGIPAPAERLDA